MCYSFSFPTIKIINEYFGSSLSDSMIEAAFKWHGYDKKNAASCTGKEYVLYSSKKQNLIEHDKSFEIMGFDIPVLISPEESVKGTIMILAQDPLRRIKDFSQLQIENSLKANIIIGLPFAVQCKMNSNGSSLIWHGEKSDNKYDGIITRLLQEHYSVYITDVRKFYAGKYVTKQGKNVQVPAYSANNQRREGQRKILMDEINNIKPEIIAAMGKLAQTEITEVLGQRNSRIVEFPHPSGSNNAAWAQMPQKGYAARAEYIANKIIAHILE